jgi:AhpD family alkylhydroperoxidase
MQAAALGERIGWETFQQLAPQVLSSLRSIGQAVAGSTLEKELLELVKMRVSQINGCAFCLQLHLNDARKLNTVRQKLDLLATWRDAGIYSDREMAALEWAEALTRQAQQHIDDERFLQVSRHFSEQEVVFLSAAIGQINFWNRIAAPFRFAPPIPGSAA